MEGAYEEIFDGSRNSIWFLETNFEEVKDALIALMEKEELLWFDDPDENGK